MWLVDRGALLGAVEEMQLKMPYVGFLLYLEKEEQVKRWWCCPRKCWKGVAPGARPGVRRVGGGRLEASTASHPD